MPKSKGAVAEPPVEVKPQPRRLPEKSAPRPRQLPPYKVLLHNDDVNDMLHVVKVICELTPLEPNDAILKMTEAHKTGVALLLVTHKERAELYAEQFATFKITVTIEPAE